MKLELSSIFTDSIMAELERLDLVNEENKWHQLYTLAQRGILEFTGGDFRRHRYKGNFA